MDDEEARTRLLDAAETLFYAEGIQAVGMDRIRAASGVPLKRLYRVFPAKESLVTAYLERRDRRWTASLRTAVSEAPDPILGVFDWLADWFREPDFRGCAFLNAYGELGTGPEAVVDVIRRHKAELRNLLADLAGPDRERSRTNSCSWSRAPPSWPPSTPAPRRPPGPRGGGRPHAVRGGALMR